MLDQTDAGHLGFVIDTHQGMDRLAGIAGCRDEIGREEDVAHDLAVFERLDHGNVRPQLAIRGGAGNDLTDADLVQKLHHQRFGACCAGGKEKACQHRKCCNHQIAKADRLGHHV
jgi:hypothetical protein